VNFESHVIDTLVLKVPGIQFLHEGFQCENLKGQGVNANSDLLKEPKRLRRVRKIDKVIIIAIPSQLIRRYHQIFPW
jgi:hypothetical protein